MMEMSDLEIIKRFYMTHTASEGTVGALATLQEIIKI